MGARITNPRDLKKHFREIYNAVTEAEDANDYGGGWRGTGQGMRENTACLAGHGRNPELGA